MEGTHGSLFMKAFWGFLFSLILWAMPGWAALGEPEVSVNTDQRYTRSQHLLQTFETYRVHQLTTANGSTIREHVSPQGLVFGVSWEGPFMPDMRLLLGTYAGDLSSAPQAQTQIRYLRGLIVNTGNFVFVNSGHLRFSKGRAYVPSLIPGNVGGACQ